MLNFILPIAFLMITIALILNTYRIIIGPTLSDRILALDTLSINAIALIVLASLSLDTVLYFEAALLIALMGFIATVALSKYILRGDIME
ncbi:MAG TPA: K+/H+ antiporter subunit F [Epsilonproteobacteria bacterium]|nr:K+/H+ antiporter subunit F [Campylobacterota bacterium]